MKEGDVPLIDLDVDPPTGQNIEVPAMPGHRDPLKTPSLDRGVSTLSYDGGQPTVPSPKDGLHTPPSLGGGLITTPSTSMPTPRLVQIGTRHPRVAYPGPPCNMMVNLNAIGSLESLKLWDPLESL